MFSIIKSSLDALNDKRTLSLGKSRTLISRFIVLYLLMIGSSMTFALATEGEAVVESDVHIKPRLNTCRFENQNGSSRNAFRA